MNLKDNKLGGAITADVATFTNLTYFDVEGMDLEGASRRFV